MPRSLQTACLPTPSSEPQATAVQRCFLTSSSRRPRSTPTVATKQSSCIFPELEGTKSSQTQIFEGSIHDIPLLTGCIRDCTAVFLVVSTNDNIPRCHMAQDTAVGVIEALETLKTESGAPVPSCRSSCFSRPRRSTTNSPALRLLSYGGFFSDRPQTCTVISGAPKTSSAHSRTRCRRSLSSLGAVSHGHAPSLTEEKSPGSYADLAADMVEAADDADGRFDIRDVGVVSVNGPARFPPGAPMCIFMGFVRHYLPCLHAYLPSIGPA